MHGEIVPATGREFSLAIPMSGVRYPGCVKNVLAANLERHQLTPAIPGLKVPQRVNIIRELFGNEDAPTEIAFRPLGRSGRLRLMLKFDAVTLTLPSGIRAINPQGVPTFAHGIFHHLDAVCLGDAAPLGGRSRLEVATPDDILLHLVK